MESLPERPQSLDFRRRLKREVSHWRESGIIDGAQQAQFFSLYQLDGVVEPNERTLLGTIVTFGMLLVGLGVISLVAANWQFIPALLKVVLLFAALWGAYGSGFWLWKVRPGTAALGQGLILLGSVIYGANIALFGQIFHIDGPFYQLALVWTIGVLAVAYALRSLPNGLLAVGIASVGYFNWLVDGGSMATSQLAPWGGLLLFLPLAYLLASRLLFELVCVGFAACTIGGYFLQLSFFNTSAYAPLLLSLLLVSLWVWLVSGLAPGADGVPQSSPSRRLVAFTLGGLCYFHGFWFGADALAGKTIPGSLWAAFFLSPMTLLLILSALVVLVWRRQALKPSWKLGLLVAGIALPIALPLPGWSIVVWSNAVLLGLGGLLVWSGLKQVRRGDFLLGQSLIAWMILSRFFEYDTGLVLKAVAFIAAGGALVFFALWFEKQLKGQQDDAHNNA